jgi:hypothetical protein
MILVIGIPLPVGLDGCYYWKDSKAIDDDAS